MLEDIAAAIAITLILIALFEIGYQTKRSQPWD